MLVLTGKYVEAAEEIQRTKDLIGVKPIREMTEEEKFKVYMLMNLMEADPDIILLFDIIARSFALAMISDKGTTFIQCIKDACLAITEKK